MNEQIEKLEHGLMICEATGTELVHIEKADAERILALLKEQEAVIRCRDCENWIPGYITDQDDFIPPKCGKYQQMVGHSADDFCSLAEKQEGR